MIERKCFICSVNYWVWPGRAAKTKYCSNKCCVIGNGLKRIGSKLRPETIEKIRRSKLRVGNSYVTEEYRNKMREISMGDKSPLWRGGLTKINKTIRNSSKFRQWRNAVFERDDYICQKCFVRGVYLESHHIVSFARLLVEYEVKDLISAVECRELWDINNGQTLCRNCHKLTDSYGGNNKRYGVCDVSVEIIN